MLSRPHLRSEFRSHGRRPGFTLAEIETRAERIVRAVSLDAPGFVRGVAHHQTLACYVYGRGTAGGPCPLGLPPVQPKRYYLPTFWAHSEGAG